MRKTLEQMDVSGTDSHKTASRNLQNLGKAAKASELIVKGKHMEKKTREALKPKGYSSGKYGDRIMTLSRK